MTKEFRQPDEIISEHLVLRKSVDERDLENYLMHIRQADEFYFQYGQPYSDELYSAINFHYSEVIYFTVFLKDTDIMVGYVGIMPECEFAQGEIEGYIFKEYRRKHYAAEALRALIDWYLSLETESEEPRNIYSREVPENEPCIKLMQHLGFTEAARGMTGSCAFILYELNKGVFWSR